MKTLLVLAGLVALAMSGAVPPKVVNFKTKNVDAEFVTKQKKIFNLFFAPSQISKDAEYYKIATEWSIEANIENYTNKQAVEDFLVLYKHGFLPRNHVFSIFYEKQRDEAIALFHLFYYAKDFETFYKTAAYARVFLNEGQFLYAYYIAIIHRPDTKGIVLPAPYELYPEFFVNYDVLYRMYRTKMQDGISNPGVASQYGITLENDNYVYYTNYSNYWAYGDKEYKLSYFTEDIGLNSYYYYFHSFFPFWLEGDVFTVWKDRRGEAYYYFYKQLIARYYLERLSNGLGEIPEFSWTKPIKSGYIPFLTYYFPFVQRHADYQIPYEGNVQELKFLDTYETTFLQYLERGRFKAYNQEVDFSNSKSVNFVGNYWQSNVDLYEKVAPRNYHRSYEITARRLLGASPETADKYSYIPNVLDFYQTSLRDPVFYQLYSRILKYFIQYKEYLAPYTQDLLHYVGVKVTDVTVDKLITYFEYFDFDVSNAVFFTPEQLKTYKFTHFKVRQPRINHRPFTVTVNVKSDVEGDAVIKVFLGPKYNGEGFPLTLEDNWMNFVELDWFVYKLKVGQNKIDRSSTDFLFYKEDSVPTAEIWKLLDQGKVPVMRTARNMFIVNLAVSDALVCCVGTPLTLMELLTKHWPLPDWPSLCKACGAIQAISIFVSTISITAIALDRYQLIVYPTRPGLQTMGALVTMLCIWVTAFCLASPLYIFRNLKTHNIGLKDMDSLSFCIEDWPMANGRAIYSLFSLILQYLLPVLVVIMAHVQIHRRLRGRRRTTRKTPAILIAIAVTYVISWLPLNVFNLVADFSTEPILEEKSMTITYAICHMFGMSSAVSNPLLYGWLNDNFRKEFEEILCCCKKRQIIKDTRIKNRKIDTELTALAQIEHTVTANTKTSQCSQIF